MNNIYPKIDISKAALYELNFTTITPIIYPKADKCFIINLKLCSMLSLSCVDKILEKCLQLSYLNKHR